MARWVSEFRRDGVAQRDEVEPADAAARPVVVPNSPPFSRMRSPNSSWSSVGNGPAPTRVA